ncbi:MAG: ABC transporter permease [Oscillospiraceae bacterium]|nr:ABC transporter permease [Oscillospiraceae bacterium]
MKKYLIVQFKRMAKALPLAMAVMLLLFSGLLAVLHGLLQSRSESEELKKYVVGIVGDPDSAYMHLGISAISSLDETRFSIELKLFDDEESALRELKAEEISSYFVFPAGFIEMAMHGEILPIRAVALQDPGSFILLLKEELAEVITEVVVETQKGIYGVSEALDANGHHALAAENANRLSEEYFRMLFRRSDLYETEELGVADALPLPTYYFCSFTVFFLLLMGLPFAAVFVKKDLSLQRMLASARISPLRQTACEYGIYTGITAGMFLLLFLLLGLLKSRVEVLSTLGIFDLHGPLALALLSLPLVLLAASFGELLFELSGELVSGILLHFFVTLALCYITGCFYPLYAFPAPIQALAPFLPTGAARSYFASLLTGESPLLPLLLLSLYAAGFFALTAAVRKRKLCAA